MNSGQSEDILAQFQRFELSARQRVARLETLQSQIDDLLTIPDPVAVTARLEPDGRISHLSIDAEEARSLSVEQLERDINVALAAAARRRPQADPEQVRAQAEYQGLNLTELIETVFSSERHVFSGPPSPRWNESRSVAVTLQGSVVVQIACDHTWMRSSSTDTIAAAIVSAVDQAIDDISQTSEGGADNG